MIAISGTYRDGKVIFSAPPEWQEGAVVRVELDTEYVGVGMREEDWPLEGERLAEWMRKVDALEPFLTPEEEADWETALQSEKMNSLSAWNKEIADVEKLFP